VKTSTAHRLKVGFFALACAAFIAGAREFLVDVMGGEQATPFDGKDGGR
jgi:predicted MFS family arabinose efflux permease